MLGFLFELVPVLKNIVRIIDIYISENVRMTIYHLLCDIVAYIVEFKPATLFFDLAVKNRLKKQISEFFFKHCGVICVDSLHHLISLLQNIHPDRLMILLSVPRTAVLASEYPRHFEKIVNIILVFNFKIQIVHFQYLSDSFFQPVFNLI